MRGLRGVGRVNNLDKIRPEQKSGCPLGGGLRLSAFSVCLPDSIYEEGREGSILIDDPYPLVTDRLPPSFWCPLGGGGGGINRKYGLNDVLSF